MDLRSTAPWGLKDIADDDEFRRKYRHRLHRYAPRILGQLEELRASYPDVMLVLMCFERDRSDCHRQQLAEWLTERLGVEVPEIGSPSIGDTSAARWQQEVLDESRTVD